MHIFLREHKEDHPLSRIDARIKLVCAAGLLSMVLTNKGAFFPSVVALACLALCAWLRVPVRRLLVRLSEPAFIVAVLIAIRLLFGGKEPMAAWHVWGIDVTFYKDGLASGLILGLRIISTVFVVAVLDFATPFTRLLGGLAWFRVPKGIIDTALFAYRYIFLLLEDATVIYNAQKNRLGYSSLRRALSSFGVLAAALVLKAFDGSQNAALAMTQRGYDGVMPSIAGERLKASHLAASALFLVAMGVLWKM